MPNIDLIPEVLYSPLDPYHFVFDNLPLINILARIQQVNFQVDIDAAILRESVGNQGSLANRLARSLNDDGSLKQSEIDLTLHSVGAHTDGVYNGVEYVRMKKSESDKLALITDSATNISLKVNTGSTIVDFTSGVVELIESTGISWTVTGSNKVQPTLNLPTDGLHKGFYDQVPVPVSLPSNYKDYKVSTSSTPYIDGSLRVYVNGHRLTEGTNMLVPVGAIDTTTTPLNPTRTKAIQLQFSSSSSTGTFSLSSAISGFDIIRVDFDILYLS